MDWARRGVLFSLHSALVLQVSIGWSHLKAYLHMPGDDAGHPLQPQLDLSMWLFDFLRASWLDSKPESPTMTRQSCRVISMLQLIVPHPNFWHILTIRTVTKACFAAKGVKKKNRTYKQTNTPNFKKSILWPFLENTICRTNKIHDCQS